MKFQNKALMAASFVIIWQDFDDNSVPFCLYSAFAFIERNGQSCVTLIYKVSRIVWEVELTPSDIDGYKEDNYRN